MTTFLESLDALKTRAETFAENHGPGWLAQELADHTALIVSTLERLAAEAGVTPPVAEAVADAATDVETAAADTAAPAAV